MKCERDRKRMSNVAGEGEEHSMIWGMFMAVTMNAATFRWRISKTIRIPLWIHQISHWRKMFDISSKIGKRTWRDLPSGYDSLGKSTHGNICHWLVTKTIINLQRAKVYVFSDSVLCLGRVHQYPKSNEAWRDRIGWITNDQSYRNFDRIDGEPTEFEWKLFPRIHYVAALW